MRLKEKLCVDESQVEALAALAQISRLAIFFYLVRSKKEVCAGEIQKALGLAGPTLSFHLELLKRAGLIERRKEKRFLYYSVCKSKVAQLVRLLTACC